jgi:hypothetical protein
MSEYRITVVYKQTLIIEGEGNAEFAEKRAEELRSGVISEEKNEVSSFRNNRTVSKVEFLVDGHWVELTS